MQTLHQRSSQENFHTFDIRNQVSEHNSRDNVLNAPPPRPLDASSQGQESLHDAPEFSINFQKATAHSSINVINGNQVIRVNASDPASIINSGRKEVSDSNPPSEINHDSLSGVEKQMSNGAATGQPKPDQLKETSGDDSFVNLLDNSACLEQPANAASGSIQGEASKQFQSKFASQWQAEKHNENFNHLNSTSNCSATQPTNFMMNFGNGTESSHNDQYRHLLAHTNGGTQVGLGQTCNDGNTSLSHVLTYEHTKLDPTQFSKMGSLNYTSSIPINQREYGNTLQTQLQSQAEGIQAASESEVLDRTKLQPPNQSSIEYQSSSNYNQSQKAGHHVQRTYSFAPPTISPNNEPVAALP